MDSRSSTRLSKRGPHGFGEQPFVVGNGTYCRRVSGHWPGQTHYSVHGGRIYRALRQAMGASSEPASASTPPSHIHRNCCLLWCIHFVVGAIPERTTVGPKHHLGRARVPNSHCCVANIFPSQNNFRIIDYPSIVKIIDDRRIRRAGLSSKLFLLRCAATLHDARTPCSEL